MEELKHISPEFDWGDGTTLGNDIVYCASSTGLNSPVLFHHFLQLSIRSSNERSILTDVNRFEFYRVGFQLVV